MKKIIFTFLLMFLTISHHYKEIISQSAGKFNLAAIFC